MVTLEQVVNLVRAQKAAGFFAYLQLQEHIDAAVAQLTGAPIIERNLSEWCFLLFRAVPLLWWQLLFLIVWGLLLLRASVWWQKKHFWRLVLTFFSLLLLAPCVWVRYRLSAMVDAVVKERTAIYSGPSQSFVQMGDLGTGAIVAIEAEYTPRPGVVFAKIAAAKKRAWIEKSDLEIV
ncbi:MAG: hypothetical protein PVJ92_02535 [Candidatus Dependentiae bacterium]|jgi:hypothetical protein